MAAAIGKPLPDRCEGVNLLPYLKGEKQGDAHEYIFWHNADHRRTASQSLRGSVEGLALVRACTTGSSDLKRDER